MEKDSEEMSRVQESAVPYGSPKTEDRVLLALRRTARETYITHKKMGWPIIIWEDGKVVTVQPEDIVIPPEV